MTKGFDGGSSESGSGAMGRRTGVEGTDLARACSCAMCRPPLAPSRSLESTRAELGAKVDAMQEQLSALQESVALIVSRLPAPAS